MAVLLAVACYAPFQLAPFRVFQLTMVLVYAVALLGLNLLVGHAGQISLGHGAFFAVGAYTAAVMIDRWDTPLPGDPAGRRRGGVRARPRARPARPAPARAVPGPGDAGHRGLPGAAAQAASRR